MNNLFDRKTSLGAAFDDIFGQSANVKPQNPPAPPATKSQSAVARIGAARPMPNTSTTR